MSDQLSLFTEASAGPATFGLTFRGVAPISRSYVPLIERTIQRETPLSSLLLRSLRFAARAAPAAFC